MVRWLVVPTRCGPEPPGRLSSSLLDPVSMAAHLGDISVLAELERSGIDYVWGGSSDVKITCPFHENDTSPSCSVGVETRLFHCHAASCGEKGDIVTLLAKLWQTTRQLAVLELGKRYKLEDRKTIHPDAIERYHNAIWEAEPLLAELAKRGIGERLIRKYRLGVEGSRITIPVKNHLGEYVNVRKYLPGAPGAEKMRNAKGCGKMRAFPIEQLDYDRLVVCGGECKAIVAADELNPHGIGAFCVTAGEGNWDAEFTNALKNKSQVWVLLDIDKGGQDNAKLLCNQIRRVAGWVGNVELPLSLDKYPHGDINDYVVTGGLLLPLLEACPEYAPDALVELNDNEEPSTVSLAESVQAKYTGKRVALRCVVAAMSTAPYVLPHKVHVDCDRSQRECAVCPVHQLDQTDHKISAESPYLLDMMDSSRAAQRAAIMLALSIPPTCRVCQFIALSHHGAEDVRLSPELEITSRTTERVMQPAVCVGNKVELNEIYDMTGRMHAHPKTQQATLVISKSSPTQDALSTYSCDHPEYLDIFRPSDWTQDSVQLKLQHIYDDLSANVTRIFRRNDIHLAIDLAYHSPLLIKFDGKQERGWVQVLILGDSSQGKSETFDGMMKHYGLGAKCDCKNASVAGLLGGLQHLGNRWFVTWGVIPTHDKRLVCLEELKGTSVETIGKLTDMRSSGIAELPKIEKRRTHARTRLVCLSNPRSDAPLATYNFGVVAVRELIGNPEDIRRFDNVLMVGAGEIDAADLNKLQRERPVIGHVYYAELCRRLVLWAWTRTADQVIFDAEVSDYLLKTAIELCDRYVEVIPIVDRGSMRYKLARLSASLACRTFSTTPDRQSVVVRKCHIDVITAYLNRCYDSQVCGYKSFSDSLTSITNVSDPIVVKRAIEATPFPKDFVKHVLNAEQIDIFDIMDWCAWDREEASELLSLLVRKYAFVRTGRHYRKSQGFIAMLKAWLETAEFTDRPEHIREPEF